MKLNKSQKSNQKIKPKNQNFNKLIKIPTFLKIKTCKQIIKKFSTDLVSLEIVIKKKVLKENNKSNF